MNAPFQQNRVAGWLLFAAVFLLCGQAYAQKQLLRPYLGTLSIEQMAIVKQLNANPTIKRVQVAQINVNIFNEHHIQANLFDDFSVPLTRQDIGHTGIKLPSWTGTYERDLCSGAFVINGKRVSGHVVSIHGNVEIFPLGQDGLHAIAEHDPSKFHGCIDSGPKSKQAPIKTPEPDRRPDDNGNEAPLDENGDIRIDDQPENNGDECFIRVIVGYTALAQTQTQADFGRSMIEHIDLAVLESNQGYANSQVEQRMELAYLYLTADDETNNACNDVDNLQSSGDSKWNEIHTHRNNYDGDMCCLITGGLYAANADCNPNGGLCGLAFDFTYTSAGNMFQVTEYSCATGNFTFAHEFGHTQGCRHDNDNTGTPFDYARGYNEGANFRTIMAVCCSPTRINWWSNPNVSYLTFGPTGFADRDNARALNAGDDVVSHHRTTPSTFDHTGTIPDDHAAHMFATDVLNSTAEAQSGSVMTLRSYGKIQLKPGFRAREGSFGSFFLDSDCPGTTYARPEGRHAEAPAVVPTEAITALVAPNPFADQFRVTVNLPAEANVSMSLVDPFGRQLARPMVNVRMPAGSFETGVETGQLGQGMYYLLIEAGETRLVQKVVKFE